MVRLSSAARCSISEGEKASISIAGNVAASQRSRSSYQPMRSAGLCPPCIRIRVPPSVGELLDLRRELPAREDVRLGIARRPEELAERAVGDAHVRVVDVAVDEVRGLGGIRVAVPHRDRRLAELRERCALVEPEAFLEADAGVEPHTFFLSAFFVSSKSFWRTGTNLSFGTPRRRKMSWPLRASASRARRPAARSGGRDVGVLGRLAGIQQREPRLQGGLGLVGVGGRVPRRGPDDGVGAPALA